LDYQGKKFLVIDGSSLAHRAFYALPPLSNRQGVPTNAAYGFLTMLFKILDQEPFDYVAVAFDKSRITFRTELFSDYKGHRKATPPELKPQFDLIKGLLDALRIPNYELENFEADDLIGTLAHQADDLGINVSILTGDRDALQLITEKTKVLLTRKGISEIDVYDLQKIKEKYDLMPKQLIDVKGLMGDTSDNIPGVPGIGEKTALKLINKYQSLEEVLSNADLLSGAKLKENLKTYAEQAVISKKLATIDLEVPLQFSIDDCLHQEPDHHLLLARYRELEFNSLIEKTLADLGQKEEQPADSGGTEVYELAGWEDFQEKWQLAASSNILALEFRLDSAGHLKGNLVGIGFATVKGAWGLTVKQEQQEELLSVLKPALLSPDKTWLFHDSKQIIVFCNRFNVRLAGSYRDTMLAAYLLNPSRGQQSLAEILLEHLNLPLVEGENSGVNIAQRALSIFKLHGSLEEKLTETTMLELYREIELPLAYILADMETKGVKLDLQQLEQMGQKLDEQIQQLTSNIYLLAGEEFNINSPKQLAGILFDKLGLPPLKKTKTGYSTNAEVLEELAPRHPIILEILHYRQLVKLFGTYIEGLKALANPDNGMVHTTFNQAITATGRLSSQEPNLQNIPIRMEQGRLIRKAFIPAQEGQLFLAADYSQIELRVLAHISKDKNLIDAFMKDQDIHSRTASEVFGVLMERVDANMRRQAKAVNFGIVYGISDFGLSRDLGISVGEAEKFIKLYFERYAGVKSYIDNIIKTAKIDGYVSTILNRRRYLPEIFSSNRNLRSFGERAAMNTPIQGSAADIIKLAMIKIAGSLVDQGLKAKMILQVHDELIFEVPREELDAVARLVRGGMEEALELDVPLKVEIKIGYNWYDMDIMKE